MKIVHIKTDGMHCDECPVRIETEIEHLPGVKAARTYRSMHLTSVLYDAEIVDANTIRDRVANVGFDASVVVRSELR